MYNKFLLQAVCCEKLWPRSGVLDHDCDAMFTALVLAPKSKVVFERRTGDMAKDAWPFGSPWTTEIIVNPKHRGFSMDESGGVGFSHE